MFKKAAVSTANLPFVKTNQKLASFYGKAFLKSLAVSTVLASSMMAGIGQAMADDDIAFNRSMSVVGEQSAALSSIHRVAVSIGTLPQADHLKLIQNVGVQAKSIFSEIVAGQRALRSQPLSPIQLNRANDQMAADFTVFNAINLHLKSVIRSDVEAMTRDVDGLSAKADAIARFSEQFYKKPSSLKRDHKEIEPLDDEDLDNALSERVLQPNASDAGNAIQKPSFVGKMWDGVKKTGTSAASATKKGAVALKENVIDPAKKGYDTLSGVNAPSGLMENIPGLGTVYAEARDTLNAAEGIMAAGIDVGQRQAKKMGATKTLEALDWFDASRYEGFNAVRGLTGMKKHTLLSIHDDAKSAYGTAKDAVGAVKKIARRNLEESN